MIIKYMDKNNKEITKHDIIALRKGLSSIEYRYRNGSTVEVQDVDSFYIAEETSGHGDKT